LAPGTNGNAIKELEEQLSIQKRFQHVAISGMVTLNPLQCMQCLLPLPLHASSSNRCIAPYAHVAACNKDAAPRALKINSATHQLARCFAWRCAPAMTNFQEQQARSEAARANLLLLAGASKVSPGPYNRGARPHPAAGRPAGALGPLQLSQPHLAGSSSCRHATC
jgi:hypothetical protein